MKITKLILPLAVIHCSISAIAQNLVPNPGFETNTGCPYDISKPAFYQLTLATPWNQPTAGTSDYFHTCATSTACIVPANTFGSQTANGGDGYAGFYTYQTVTANYREYIQVMLSSTLSAGVSYDLSYYISLADKSQWASNKIGAYFSATAISGGGATPLGYTPQIVNNTVITDMAAWTLVTGTFTAGGGENYITIGNFSNDAGTTVSATGISTLPIAYYYIDDICLTPSSGSGCAVLPVTFKSFKGNYSGRETELNWVTASETNNDYFSVEKSADGKTFETTGEVKGSGISVSEQEYSFTDYYPYPGSCYYRLKETDYNGNHTYSNVISVTTARCDFLQADISPNPSDGKINIRIPAGKNENVLLFISDVLGNKLFSAVIPAGSSGTTLDLSNQLHAGIYSLSVIRNEKIYNRQLIIAAEGK